MRKIAQEANRQGLSWDEPVPDVVEPDRCCVTAEMTGRERPSFPDAARLGLRTSQPNKPCICPLLACSAPDTRPLPVLLPLASRCSCSSTAPPAALAVVPTPPPTRPDDVDKCRQCKEKRQALVRKPSGLACCYSCGALILTAKEAAPGYDACCKFTFQMFQVF
jgi:hypothetical protein